MKNAHEIWLRAKSIQARCTGSKQYADIKPEIDEIIELLDLGVDGEPKHYAVSDKPIVGNS